MDFAEAEKRARWIVEEAPQLVQPDAGDVNLAECLLSLLASRESSLEKLCQTSAEIAKKSGFVGQTVPEFVALAHSELSEALEEHRAGRRPMEVHYTRESAEVASYFRQLFRLLADAPLPKGVSTRIPCDKDDVGAKPEGIPSELADVVIRVAHFCGSNGIDLAEAVREKTAFNRTRSWRHGNKAL